MAAYYFMLILLANEELYLFQEVFLNVAAVFWDSLRNVPKQPYEVRKGFVEIFRVTMPFPDPLCRR